MLVIMAQGKGGKGGRERSVGERTRLGDGKRVGRYGGWEGWGEVRVVMR